MKNAPYFLTLAMMLSLLLACKKNIEHNPALFGKWQGQNWIINDQPSDIDAAQVHFEFKEDGTYSASFSNQQESGTWYTEKDRLYTTAQGKQKIMVKLLKADGTDLHFEMNRTGRKETLELRKTE